MSHLIRKLHERKIQFVRMRKYLIPLLISLSVIITSQVQAQLEVGAHLGINSGNLYGDSPVDFKYQSKIGAAFGVILNIPLTEDVRLSIQPGLLQHHSNIAYKDKEAGEVRDSITVKMSYVRIPVLMQVLSNSEKWQFSAGLDAQFATSQKASTDIDEVDLSEDLSSFNLAVVFGLGRRIPIGKSILTVDLHFTQGIQNITNTEQPETSLVPRVKTSGVQLLVGILIPLKKSS